MFGTLKMRHKKCPYSSFAKTMADELDAMKSVPVGCKSKGSEMLGYPKRCNYLCANRENTKIMGYPTIFARLSLGLNVIESVTADEKKSGNRHFAKRVSPLRVNH